MPRKSNSQFVGDCTINGIAKKAHQVYKASNVKNPLKTDNFLVDLAIGSTKYGKAWNTGFTVGKVVFMAKQTYDETCKRKK